MAYKTLYQIFDTTTKQVLFSNRNSSCFAEWTYHSRNAKDSPLNWEPNRYMEIYFSISETENKCDDLVEFWSKVLNNLGFKMTFEKKDFTGSLETLPPAIIKDLNWVCTMNYDDYSSKNQFKLGLHLMRYLYESDSYKILEQTKKLSEEFPDIHPYELFQYRCGQIDNNVSGLVHYIFFKGIVRDFQTAEELKQQFELWKNSEYTQNSIDVMRSKYGSIRSISKESYPELYDKWLTLGRSSIPYLEYKEVINKIKEVNGKQ